MAVSTLVNQLLPPGLKHGLRALLAPLIGFTKANSWADAAARTAGYEDDTVLSGGAISKSDRTSRELSSRDLQLLAAFFAAMPGRSGEPVRVLDIGGAAGDHFDLIAGSRPDATFEWTVLETAKLAARMQPRTNGHSQVKWIDDIEGVNASQDIALLSSVLQYVEQPHELIERASRAAGVLIINRLPLIDATEDVPTVQKLRMYGYRGSYPAWFLSKEKFSARIHQIGEIVTRWQVPEDTHVLGVRSVVCEGMVVRVER